MIALRWPTVAGRRYAIERSAAISGASWESLAGPITDDGQVAEFIDTSVTDRPQFYRLRLVE